MDDLVYDENSGYFSDVFGDWEVFLDQARKEFEHADDFDTIIGTGMSGCLVVPRLAADLGLHWAVVRKPDVKSHSSKAVEGRVGKRWVFVDDFVSSGATYQRVRETVAKHQFIAKGHSFRDGYTALGTMTTLVGCYEYQHGGRFTHWGSGGYEYLDLSEPVKFHPIDE